MFALLENNELITKNSDFLKTQVVNKLKNVLRVTDLDNCKMYKNGSITQVPWETLPDEDCVHVGVKGTGDIKGLYYSKTRPSSFLETRKFVPFERQNDHGERGDLRCGGAAIKGLYYSKTRNSSFLETGKFVLFERQKDHGEREEIRGVDEELSVRRKKGETNIALAYRRGVAVIIKSPTPPETINYHCHIASG